MKYKLSKCINLFGTVAMIYKEDINIQDEEGKIYKYTLKFT